MKKNIGAILVGLYILAIMVVSMSASAANIAVSTSGLAMAQTATATISADPSVGQELAVQDFLMQVVDVIKQLGGMKTMIAISAVLTLIVSSMKVSFLNNLIWSKLGAMKTFAAPVLALVAGLLGLGAGGVPVTGQLVVAYLFAGGGAVFLHEILDSVKSIPGIGAIYISLIDFVSGLLKGPEPKA